MSKVEMTIVSFEVEGTDRTRLEWAPTYIGQVPGVRDFAPPVSCDHDWKFLAEDTTYDPGVVHTAYTCSICEGECLRDPDLKIVAFASLEGRDLGPIPTLDELLAAELEFNRQRDYIAGEELAL